MPDMDASEPHQSRVPLKLKNLFVEGKISIQQLCSSAHRQLISLCVLHNTDGKLNQHKSNIDQLFHTLQDQLVQQACLQDMVNEALVLMCMTINCMNANQLSIGLVFKK